MILIEAKEKQVKFKRTFGKMLKTQFLGINKNLPILRKLLITIRPSVEVGSLFG
jgi:hypothetical protein